MAHVSFLPAREPALVTWLTNFKTKIATMATSVGVSAGQVTTYNGLCDAFIAAYNVCNSDASNSRSATITKNQAKEAVLTNVRMLSGIIQKYPGTTNTQRADLGLTVTKPRTPAGPPGLPYGFKLKLGTTGALELSWKNSDATGCVYAIYRKVGASGPLVNLGGTNVKKFTDTTVPAGATQLQYQIQAIRASGTSDWARFDVSFGGGASGMFITEREPLKVAA